MPTKAFVDSNVFIFGFERRGSNSHGILEMLSTGDLRGVVTDRIVREVMQYFRRYYSKDLAAEFRDFILLTCDLCLEADLRIRKQLVVLVGPKDAGALAATRDLGLARLISTDRDFTGIPERRTPHEFLRDMGERPRAGEE